MSKIDLSAAPRWTPLSGLEILAAGTRYDLPGATFGPRTQFSWELVWVRQGSVQVRINQRQFAVGEGGIVLVPPGVIDQYDWSTKRRCSHSFIHFRIGSCGKGWPTVAGWPQRVALSPNHLVHQLIERITSLPVEAPRAWTLLGVPMLELILRVLLVEPDLPASPQVGLPRCVDRALTTMHEILQREPIQRTCLSDLGRAARVDPAYLCRAFRKHLGVGPIHCLRLLRMDRAVSLLERSDRAIKEIADMSGFADSFHFSRVFRQTFGCSPTRYRDDFRRGKVHRLVTPALRQLAAQRIVWCKTSNDPDVVGFE